MSYADLTGKYLKLLEDLQADESLYRDILHPEVEQTEYPNALNPKGQHSDRADLLRRMKMAQTIIARQSYTIRQIHETPQTAIVETDWTGSMAIDAGPLKKGQTLNAKICFVLEFKDGLIYRQRNYDCFQPF